MINRATKITVDYCPLHDDSVDVDEFCGGCDHFSRLNSDGEVICTYTEEAGG